MERKSKFTFQLILGILTIGAVIFLSFRYLMKGSPLLKVLALGLIIVVSYLVVDYLKRKAKYK